MRKLCMIDMVADDNAAVAACFDASSATVAPPSIRLFTMPAATQAILNLEVPLIVTIGACEMPLRDVLNLAPGSVLELSKSAGDELDVSVGNMPIGAGRAVRVGDHLGVRITHVGDMPARLDLARTTPRAATIIDPAPIHARDHDCSTLSA